MVLKVSFMRICRIAKAKWAEIAARTLCREEMATEEGTEERHDWGRPRRHVLHRFPISGFAHFEVGQCPP